MKNCSLLNKSGSHSEIKAVVHILDIRAGRVLWGLFNSKALQVPYLCYFFFKHMLPKKREEVHTAIHLWCSVVLTENRQGNKDHVFLRDQKKSSSIHGIISAIVRGQCFSASHYFCINSKVSARITHRNLLSPADVMLFFCPGFCLSGGKQAPSWSSDKWKSHPSEDACKHYASILEYEASVDKHNKWHYCRER